MLFKQTTLVKLLWHAIQHVKNMVKYERVTIPTSRTVWRHTSVCWRSLRRHWAAVSDWWTSYSRYYVLQHYLGLEHDLYFLLLLQLIKNYSKYENLVSFLWCHIAMITKHVIWNLLAPFWKCSFNGLSFINLFPTYN